MSSRARLMVVTALLAVGAGACGGDGTGNGDPVGARAEGRASDPPRVLRTAEGHVLRLPPGCGPVPAELRGAWEYELRPEDIPPEWSDARTGRAERIYGPGYRYTAPVAGKGTIIHACVKGDEVHSSDYPDCPGEGNEVLRWRVRGDELTLTPVRSGCFVTTIHFGDPWRSRTLRRSGPAPKDSAMIPGELIGTWSQRTTADEPPPEVADIRTGTHRLRLAADGTAALVTPDGGVTEFGVSEARKNNLRFSAPDDGPCASAWAAEYHYRVAGGKLRLAPLFDPCPYSRWQFAVHAWNRAG